MASVEYYFQTQNPHGLRDALGKTFGYEVEIHPAEFETQIDKPDVDDLTDWYRVDSFEEYMSEGHSSEVKKIQDLSSYYDDVAESHDTIMDAFWQLGQGLN